MKTGIEIIAEERQRQIEVEKWSIEHDLSHTDGVLAQMAATYALPPYFRQGMIDNIVSECTLKGICPTWPYYDVDAKWFKPTPNDRIRELAKAGALIAAEIDRINKVNELEKNLEEE